MKLTASTAVARSGTARLRFGIMRWRFIIILLPNSCWLTASLLTAVRSILPAKSPVQATAGWWRWMALLISVSIRLRSTVQWKLILLRTMISAGWSVLPIKTPIWLRNIWTVSSAVTQLEQQQSICLLGLREQILIRIRLRTDCSINGPAVFLVKLRKSTATAKNSSSGAFWIMVIPASLWQV